MHTSIDHHHANLNSGRRKLNALSMLAILGNYGLNGGVQKF